MKVMEKLLHYFPLDNQLLMDLAFLHPDGQKQDASIRKVLCVAGALSKVDPDINVDDVEDEWRTLPIEPTNKPEHKHGSEPEEEPTCVVTAHWSDILQRKRSLG